MAETPAQPVTEQVQVGSPVQPELPIENKPASEAKPDVAAAGVVTTPNVEGAKPSDAGNEQKTEPVKVNEPIKYELKQPEGSLLEGRIEKIEALAKERGFSNEQAQAILDSEAAAVREFVEQTKPDGRLWVAQVEKWEQEALASKEIGGTTEKLQESARLAKEALKQSGFFPPDFEKYLHETGLGSHPTMVTALVRIRKAMSNDKAVRAPLAPSQPKPIEARLYPGDVPK
jgi:hypothetical protein